MPDIALTIDQSDGSTRRVELTSDRLLIARGTPDLSTADTLFVQDTGASRRHASINRDGDRLWALDEGSTNGTFVNDAPVPPKGTPLSDGDVIRISDATTLRIEVRDDVHVDEIPSAPHAVASAPAAAPSSASIMFPLILIGVVILLGGAALAAYSLAGRTEEPAAKRRTTTTRASTAADGFAADTIAAPAAGGAGDPVDPSLATTTPDAAGGGAVIAPVEAPPPVASYVAPALEYARTTETASYRGKRYLQMSSEEQLAFIEARAQHVSMMMGNRPYAFTDDVIKIIKTYVDGYARRVGNGSTRMWGEDLNTMFARARTNYAPHITRAFNARGVPAVVGLYLVVVETEYHNIRSENFAGAAGLFQFIAPTARGYGVDPAERTNIAKMAPAAAHYLADRIGEFGPDSMSVALAIAGYNRSPDSVRRDLRDVLNSENKERSFWTLVANSSQLDHYFQNENIKYVPKFFAAAIVGETPEAFGLNMRKLSSYTKIVATPETGAPVASDAAPPAPTVSPAPAASPAKQPAAH